MVGKFVCDKKSRVKEVSEMADNTAKMFTFTEDFANNWVAGQEVICEMRDNGKVLVDAVAEIEMEELLKHGHFESEQTQVESIMAMFRSQAIDLWQRLRESELSYEDFLKVRFFIIDLFDDIHCK